MSHTDPATEREIIEQQAADYVVALSDAPSAQLQKEAAEWVGQCADHAVAFARAERAWEAGGRLGPQAFDDINIEGPGVGASLEDPLTAPRTTRRAFMMASAAAVAGIASLAGLRWLGRDQHVDTSVGEMREMVLADGSHMRLNTSSRAIVDMRADRRLIRLIQGEAYFDVAPNPAVPFEVEVNGATVRALGTAFNIRMRADQVELTVTHGLVGVRTAEGATNKVAAGDGAFIQPDTVAVTTLDHEDVEQRTLWRERVIELRGESVAQAVDEFNRYRTRPIIIGDQRVAPLRVGGRFDLNDVDQFLAALRLTLPVKVTTGGDGGVVLMYDTSDGEPDAEYPASDSPEPGYAPETAQISPSGT